MRVFLACGAVLGVAAGTVRTPKRIKADGRTVLLTKPVLTNAGQTAEAAVTWSRKRSAKGHRAKYATWKTTKSGKVVIITTGVAKRLYVRLALSAQAVEWYTAYGHTKTWRVPAG